jgi:hypothetical protein
MRLARIQRKNPTTTERVEVCPLQFLGERAWRSDLSGDVSLVLTLETENDLDGPDGCAYELTLDSQGAQSACVLEWEGRIAGENRRFRFAGDRLHQDEPAMAESWIMVLDRLDRTQEGTGISVYREKDGRVALRARVFDSPDELIEVYFDPAGRVVEKVAHPVRAPVALA